MKLDEPLELLLEDLPLVHKHLMPDRNVRPPVIFTISFDEEKKKHKKKSYQVFSSHHCRKLLNFLELAEHVPEHDSTSLIPAHDIGTMDRRELFTGSPLPWLAAVREFVEDFCAYRELNFD